MGAVQQPGATEISVTTVVMERNGGGIAKNKAIMKEANLLQQWMDKGG